MGDLTMAMAERQLVLRLNEIWHDLENSAYDGKHPDIFEAEIPRWGRTAAEVLSGPRPAREILDLGSGTGFVPLRLRELLRPGDRLICADLSSGMLEVCRRNLEQAELPASLQLLKLDGAIIGLADHSVDLVTVNAVLHHVPEPAPFCREIDRVLRPGGTVIIGHEPNRAYRDSPALLLGYWLLLPAVDFRLFGYELLLRAGLFEALRRPLERFFPELRGHNCLLESVNARLLAEGCIDAPLPASRMSSLLDVHSPTAGGPRPDRGFAREDFLRLFPGYGMVFLETYDHLGKIRVRGGWLRRCQEWLARKFPEAGANLAVTLRKPGFLTRTAAPRRD